MVPGRTKHAGTFFTLQLVEMPCAMWLMLTKYWQMRHLEEYREKMQQSGQYKRVGLARFRLPGKPTPGKVRIETQRGRRGVEKKGMKDWVPQ